MKRAASGILLGALCACATLPEAGVRPDPPPPVDGIPPELADLPEGFGRLRPDELTIGFFDGPLRIEVVPLRQDLLRLLVPDAADRLGALARLGEPAEGGSLFLVSFFTESLGVLYEQSDLLLEQDGSLLRPTRVVGVTSRWGTGRLEQREPASAVFLFPAIDLEREFRVRYRAVTGAGWASILTRVQVERGRVRGRAGGGPQSSSSNFRIFR